MIGHHSKEGLNKENKPVYSNGCHFLSVIKSKKERIFDLPGPGELEGEIFMGLLTGSYPED